MSRLEIAMLGTVPACVLREAIFAHPTLAESWNIHAPARRPRDGRVLRLPRTRAGEPNDGRGGRGRDPDPLAGELIALFEPVPAQALHLAMVHARVGRCELDAGELDAAAASLANAETATRSVPEPWKFLRAQVDLELGRLAAVRGDRAAAMQWLEEGVAISRHLPDHELDHADLALALGRQLHERGDADERAEQMLVDATERRIDLLGIDHAESKAAIEQLVSFFEDLDRAEDAQKWEERVGGGAGGAGAARK